MSFPYGSFLDIVNQSAEKRLTIITSFSANKVKHYIPLPFLQRKKWDGYFRGIAYDFPEKLAYQRDALREQIRTWGMGRFHLSLWITPHPLEEDPHPPFELLYPDWPAENAKSVYLAVEEALAKK